PLSLGLAALWFSRERSACVRLGRWWLGCLEDRALERIERLPRCDDPPRVHTAVHAPVLLLQALHIRTNTGNFTQEGRQPSHLRWGALGADKIEVARDGPGRAGSCYVQTDRDRVAGLLAQPHRH